MFHDQADELRQLVRRSAWGVAAECAAPLIVVSGGKGGVGTTTVAVNLAAALVRQGRRAVFVDADLDHGGNTQLSLPENRGSVIDVLAGRRGVHEVLQRGPSGMQVLSGAWGNGEAVECSAAVQGRFINDLKNLAPHVDVVVIDAGSSRTPFVRRFWQAASAVLVVSTPDDTTVMQSYAAINVLLAGETTIPIHTLVNLVADAATTDDVQARLAEACRRFLGMRAVAMGGLERCEVEGRREPVTHFPPRSESARGLDRVADTLWVQLQMKRQELPGRRAATRPA